MTAIDYDSPTPSSNPPSHAANTGCRSTPTRTPAVTALTSPIRFGRVVAVVNPGKPDNYMQQPISRAHIHYNDAEAAVTGTGWPWLEHGRTINLAALRDRLHHAQLT